MNAVLVHPTEIRKHALSLYAGGANVAEISRAIGVHHRTVWDWCHRPQSIRSSISGARCPRCRPAPSTPPDEPAYALLLGFYLGDGHLLMTQRVPLLRVICDESYPKIIEQCENAMLATLAGRVSRRPKVGCVSVQSYAKHWPCLFPQHGPGRKHERPIELADWQQHIVERQPGAFLRGLFHSDGCRVTNRIVVRGRTYEYPRYMFTNKSTDIMGLCQWALDLLGIPWRMARADNLSVARREAVAALDVWVDPKS